MRTSTLVTWCTCGLLAVLSASCQNAQKNPSGDDYLMGTPQLLLEQQAQQGAKADATLNPQHFAGDSLNSLGRAKLDLILDAAKIDEGGSYPVMVYLNVPEKGAGSEAPRHQAVVAYLKDRGLSDTQFKLQSGPNPSSFSPAAGHMARLNKTESGGQGGGSGDASSGAAMTNSGTSK